MFLSIIHLNPQLFLLKIVTDLYSEIENTGRLLDTKTLDTIVGYLLSNKNSFILLWVN